MTLGKVCLYHKAEEFFPGLHLQHGSVVVPEMVIGALPQIRVRSRCDTDGSVLDFVGSGVPGPFELLQIDFSAGGKRQRHAVSEFFFCAGNGAQAQGQNQDLCEMSHSKYKSIKMLPKANL